jgi:CrcB protein
MLGTVVAGLIFGITNRAELSSLSCAALWGIEYGLCGALTTISTFVNEIHTLPKLAYSYTYGVVSILLAQVLLIIIQGGFIWTMEDPFQNQGVCFFTK